MPLQNLEYTIVHATGWDEGYPPQQLLPKDKNTADCNKNTNNNNNNSNVISIKHGKGWQSEKFCSYPQEIILQVTCGPARIRKLQILSHHYKIASKLEIYVGSVQRRKEVVGGMTNNINNDNINDDDSVKSANAKRAISWDKMPKIIEDDGMSSDEEDAIDDDDGDNNDHRQSQDDNKTKNNQNTINYDPITMNGEPYIHFRRLGYCALDSNERAHYKAREFKSVRLDAEGEYIRLVARKCHSNHLNKHNQVGLVGITVMGEPADYLLAGESRKIPIENTDDGLSRVESPEICTVPIIQENFYHPYDQRNFASLYSLLPGNNNNNNNNGNDNHVDDNGKHTSSSSLVINNVTNTFTSLLIENSTSSSSPSSPSSTSPTDAISTTSFSSSSSFSNNNEQSEIATIAPIKRKLKDYLTANDFLQNENDTTRLLSAFNKAKKNAVDVEDFRLAKVLKYSVDLMKRGVEEVARIDVLKREAVKEEDFDNADKCKQDIEAIRGDVRAALSDEGLDIDDQDEVVIYDPQLDPELQDIIGLADDDGDGSNTNNNNNDGDDNNNNNKNDDDNDKKNGIGGNNNNNNNNNAGQMTNQCHYHSTWMSQQQSNLQQQLQITDYIEEEPEELSPLARSAFALPIQYFGDFLIASLLSKKFVLRELALTEIEKRIDYHISSDNHHNRSDGDEDDVLSDKLALIKASYQVIQEGLNNHLQEKLLISTFSLWQKTIDYSIHNQVPISSTYKLAEQTYNSLFSKITESDAATDTASTIKHASLDLLVSLVRTYQDSKCSLLNNFVLKPAKTSSQPSKQAKAKLESVLRLIDEFGVSTLPREKLKLHYQHQHQLQDQEEHSVVVKMSYEHLMDFSLSYLNNNHSDVREMAVKLTFEVIKRVGKQYVEPYLVVGNNSKNIKHQDVIQDVWKLVTEYERDNGEIVQRSPTPDPAVIIVKKHSGNNENKETTADKNSALYSDVPDLTEEERRELAELEEEQERLEREKLENFEIDQTLLAKPLAKRGTITRVEQQLMELRSMMNNTNNIIKEDYDTYLANSMNPPYHREEEDGDDCGEEEVKVQTTQSKPSSSSSKKPGGSSGRNAAKPSSSSNKNSDKVKKSSGNQPSGKKTLATAKNVKGNATANNKSLRRGSTDDAKTAGGPKGSKKSLNKNLDADSLCDGTNKTKEDHSDRFCIFCDEQNDDFTEENLVVHYWNECPILTKCRLCNIILEISTLDEHMLKDCDKSKFVKQCQRCREIIEADDYLEHIAKQSCMTIRPDIVRCPLCKTVIKPATEAGWKDHLLNIDGCPRNRRKIKSSDEHVNDADGGVAVASDVVKETSAATKKRSKTSGDSPKSATTKSSGSATNRKTASAVGATSTAGKVKKTASSTTKVSKAKK